MTMECSRCQELSSAVDEVLEHLSGLTRQQLDAFRRRDHAAFARLDKELELTVGRKERTIGALREHRLLHGEHYSSQKAS